VAAEREDFLEASREAMTSERAARSTPTAAARETSWCNGATGYGLMLAAAARSADEDGSGERDVESAINAVRGDAGDGVVYLCCGAFGHVELLRFAAPTFSRPEWLSEANALASRLQARAHTAGGHRLFHELPVQVFNPGLFRGVAGIGYTLLQLASGGALPCVLLFE
jgi:lantibiotic modifying enzyme